MPCVPDLDTLGRMELFHGLACEQLSPIRALLRGRSFPAGVHFLTAEQPAEAAYILLQGTVKLYVTQPDGTDVLLAFRGPGEVLGEMALLDGLGHSASAVTLEPCALCWMDRAAFIECLRTTPRMACNLSSILSHRLRLASEQIQMLSALDVEGRIARLLLTFADEYGRAAGGGEIRIPLRLTQSDLASLVGASRMRVNQVVAGYKQRKYITIDRDYRITLRDPAALARRYR